MQDLLQPDPGDSRWRLERRGRVAVVSLHRPPENLLGFALLAELDVLLARISDDQSVHVVVLTGGIDGYFVGHADLGDVEALVAGEPGAGVPDQWNLALARLSSMTQPTVAAVNGQAWGGGCELAIACQLRAASESAHFSFVEVAAGAIPGAGGTQRLPRLIGPSKAARMVLAGEIVDAQSALALGLVDTVLASEDFLDHVLDWVDPIACQPRHTLAAAKRALVDGAALPLSEGLAYEQRLFRSVLRSPESKLMFERERS